MKNFAKHMLAFLTFISFASFNSMAQDLIVVAKEGNVYDEASAKYITLNQNNEEVAVIPGMVFATSQHTPGWFKVEYSPGLHAFIPDQIASTEIQPVKPGTYNVTNNPGQKIIVTGAGDTWAAECNGKNYKGVMINNILLFEDDNHKPAFSLTDIGNGPVAISYDNAVTKFF